MELSKIISEIDRIEDEMAKCDPASDRYFRLYERLNDLIKINHMERKQQVTEEQIKATISREDRKVDIEQLRADKEGEKIDSDISNNHERLELDKTIETKKTELEAKKVDLDYQKFFLEQERAYEEANNHKAQISESKKDRWAKILLGGFAAAVGIGSICAEDTRVICKSGMDNFSKIHNMVK